MNAVGCDEEEEDELETREGDVCCDNEGRCWSGGEDGVEEVGEEFRHGCFWGIFEFYRMRERRALRSLRL